jgi:5-methylthioribose kinase
LREILPDTLAQWLAAHGYAAPDLRLEELGGGVSNVVILASSGQFRLVVKQSLGKLRVAEEWCSDRDRIFREAEAMRWLSPRLTAGRVPRLLFTDADDFAIAMEAAAPNAEMWKTLLFRGEFVDLHAHSAGAMLGQTIAATWNDENARRIFGDQTVFDQLRIDPYYRFTARRHPDRADYFYALISRSAARSVSLVHGDWSPKNLLVASTTATSGIDLWAIDWEVVHFGDPSFDAGFLLNHLVLKSIALPHWRADFAALAQVFFKALRENLPPEAGWVEQAALEHLPALLLARVDGKSPAEYLDGAARDRARLIARDMMLHPPTSVEAVFDK